VARLAENAKDQALRVEQLKIEWKRLWKEHLDDKVRAEGVASEDFSGLFVEKGTVIFATRDFKFLTFDGILEKNGIGDAHRFVSPSPAVGGWGKFIKASIVHRRPLRENSRCREDFLTEGKKVQQSKKGGRGWLHL
jgi:hypothetical protein